MPCIRPIKTKISAKVDLELVLMNSVLQVGLISRVLMSRVFSKSDLKYNYKYKRPANTKCRWPKQEEKESNGRAAKRVKLEAGAVPQEGKIAWKFNPENASKLYLST